LAYSGVTHGVYGHTGYIDGGSYGHGSLGYPGYYAPHSSVYYWPWYSHYGYSTLGYGPYYGLYGPSYFYGGSQRYTAAYGSGIRDEVAADSTAAGASDAEARPDYQRRAEAVFQAGDYAQAVRLGNHALVETPRDGRLFLFVSQALLATDDYQGATAALYQATTLLEQKDWGYVVQNSRDYYRNNDYDRQLQRLTKFIDENPNAAYARTLRGYHYGFLGNKQAAKRDLAQAIELEKRDKLASELLAMFDGKSETAPPSLNGPSPRQDASAIEGAEGGGATEHRGAEQHHLNSSKGNL
jgi:tetratricopeptide (TPR) repeat protein